MDDAPIDLAYHAREDSVGRMYGRRARALLRRYLDRNPVGLFAPRVVGALGTMHYEETGRSGSVRGLCEGRVFHVFSYGEEPEGLKLVAVGTGERVRIPAAEGDVRVVRAEFSAPVEAVHLTEAGEVVGMAFPSFATCEAPSSYVTVIRAE